MTNCKIALGELIECGRHHEEPSAALSTHLAACASCRERRDAEQELTSYLGAIQTRAIQAASAPANLEWSKAVLMREFDAHRRRDRQVRWMWAMSSAAVLVLSVFTLRGVWIRPAASSSHSGGSATQTYPLRDYPRESFAPADEAGENGFIQVPFALPPAPGETFGIVRTQLDPADLARMGVSVDPGWSGTLQADVLVGQDGMAQAVRLSNDETSQN